MSEVIVDHFQVVHIHHDNTHFQIGGIYHQRLYHMVKACSVVESGQRILLVGIQHHAICIAHFLQMAEIHQKIGIGGCPEFLYIEVQHCITGSFPLHMHGHDQQVIRRLQISIQIRYQLPEIHVNVFFAAGSLCFRTVVMHNFHFCGVIGVLCFKCRNIHAIPEILIPHVLNILGHFQENSGITLRVGKIGNHLTHGPLEFNLRIHVLF